MYAVCCARPILPVCLLEVMWTGCRRGTKARQQICSLLGQYTMGRHQRKGKGRVGLGWYDKFPDLEQINQQANELLASERIERNFPPLSFLLL